MCAARKRSGIRSVSGCPIISVAIQPKSRSAPGLNERRIPSGSIVTIASKAVSTIARCRASLARSAPSVCIRAVMSRRVPITRAGQPAASLTTSNCPCTVRSSPSGRNKRCVSALPGVPAMIQCRTRARSAGCTRGKKASNAGTKASGSVPKRRYISSDHVIAPVVRSVSQLPSPAIRCAARCRASLATSAASAAHRAVTSRATQYIAPSAGTGVAFHSNQTAVPPRRR